MTMQMLTKTAVFGATSFYGKYFLPLYKKVYPDCVGTDKNPNDSAIQHFDLLSPSIAHLKLSKTGHQEALILCGVTGVAPCETQKDLTRRINVDGVLSLVEQLWREKIKPIFFSSDIVFDGITGSYGDHAAVGPLNEYARQKVEVEAGIKTICRDGNYLIPRLSKTFSLQKGDGSLFDEMASVLRLGRRMRVADDQIFSPLYVLDTIRLLPLLQNQQVKGIVNINPPEKWSRYDITVALARHMGVNADLIEKIKLADLGEPFLRPRNTTMRTERLQQLTHYQFEATSDCIKKVAENWMENKVSVCQ